MLLVAKVIHSKTNQDSKCWGWIFTIQLSFDTVFHTYRNYVLWSGLQNHNDGQIKSR